MRDVFAYHGVKADRLELLEKESKFENHLALYGRLDIALDPFPYNGTTTTCEALWMGVPVVTLAGHHHAARVGVSLLGTVGLPELITTTAEAYRATAVAFAMSPTRLKRLRPGMRQRIKGSSLIDGRRFTGFLEAEYRRMWGECCAAQPSMANQA